MCFDSCKLRVDWADGDEMGKLCSLGIMLLKVCGYWISGSGRGFEFDVRLD